MPSDFHYNDLPSHFPDEAFARDLVDSKPIKDAFKEKIKDTGVKTLLKDKTSLNPPSEIKTVSKIEEGDTKNHLRLSDIKNVFENSTHPNSQSLNHHSVGNGNIEILKPVELPKETMDLKDSNTLDPEENRDSDTFSSEEDGFQDPNAISPEDQLTELERMFDENGDKMSEEAIINLYNKIEELKKIITEKQTKNITENEQNEAKIEQNEAKIEQNEEKFEQNEEKFEQNEEKFEQKEEKFEQNENENKEYTTIKYIQKYEFEIVKLMKLEKYVSDEDSSLSQIGKFFRRLGNKLTFGGWVNNSKVVIDAMVQSSLIIGRLKEVKDIGCIKFPDNVKSAVAKAIEILERLAKKDPLHNKLLKEKISELEGVEKEAFRLFKLKDHFKSDLSSIDEEISKLRKKTSSIIIDLNKDKPVEEERVTDLLHDIYLVKKKLAEVKQYLSLDGTFLRRESNLAEYVNDYKDIIQMGDKIVSDKVEKLKAKIETFEEELLSDSTDLELKQKEIAALKKELDELLKRFPYNSSVQELQKQFHYNSKSPLPSSTEKSILTQNSSSNRA